MSCLQPWVSRPCGEAVVLLGRVGERDEIYDCLSQSNPPPILSNQQGCVSLLGQMARAPKMTVRN